MTNILLYALTVAIWGTSWLGVKYQLGVVAPEASAVYRFAIAAVLMLLYCALARRRMRFAPAEHVFMALQGLFLFCTNYVLIYLGTQYLTSGLVAVLFSTIVVMNIFLGALFFGSPVRRRVVLGALVGLPGIGLVFWPELAAFDLARQGTLGLVLCLAGTLSASFGMLISGRNQKQGLPVIQANAYGMTYGTLFMMAYCLAAGTSFGFDPRPLYVGSLVFLAVFATVIAFWSYLTLLGRIGADRAGYASVLFPIVALALSTVYEDYQWTLAAAFGVALVLAGNALILTTGGVGQAAPVAAPTASEETT